MKREYGKVKTSAIFLNFCHFRFSLQKYGIIYAVLQKYVVEISEALPIFFVVLKCNLGGPTAFFSGPYLQNSRF